MIPLILMLVAAWAFIAWIAYDIGYDRGWDAHSPPYGGKNDPNG
jgi:hypothetical protein